MGRGFYPRDVRGSPRALYPGAMAKGSTKKSAGTIGAATPNYWDYVRVEELLALQNGLAADESELSNDEVLFITVHQVFELWFKLILRELRFLRDFFHQELVHEQELSRAVAS